MCGCLSPRRKSTSSGFRRLVSRMFNSKGLVQNGTVEFVDMGCSVTGVRPFSAWPQGGGCIETSQSFCILSAIHSRRIGSNLLRADSDLHVAQRSIYPQGQTHLIFLKRNQSSRIPGYLLLLQASSPVLVEIVCKFCNQ